MFIPSRMCFFPRAILNGAPKRRPLPFHGDPYLASFAGYPSRGETWIRQADRETAPLAALLGVSRTHGGAHTISNCLQLIHTILLVPAMNLASTILVQLPKHVSHIEL